jgi:hypothetical protein
MFGPAPWGRDTWQATCVEISSLQSLRHLRLDFAFWSHGVDAAQEEMFYGALKCLRKTTEVHVRVSWPQRSLMQGEEAFPFELTRDVRFEEGEDGWFSLSDADEEVQRM